jgi:hypothetical protein
MPSSLQSLPRNFISSLPRNVIGSIMRFLPAREVVRAAKTSRQMHASIAATVPVLEINGYTGVLQALQAGVRLQHALTKLANLRQRSYEISYWNRGGVNVNEIIRTNFKFNKLVSDALKKYKFVVHHIDTTVQDRITVHAQRLYASNASAPISHMKLVLPYGDGLTKAFYRSRKEEAQLTINMNYGLAMGQLLYEGRDKEDPRGDLAHTRSKYYIIIEKNPNAYERMLMSNKNNKNNKNAIVFDRFRHDAVLLERPLYRAALKSQADFSYFRLKPWVITHAPSQKAKHGYERFPTWNMGLINKRIKNDTKNERLKFTARITPRPQSSTLKRKRSS